jgi:hypothetical protein
MKQISLSPAFAVFFGSVFPSAGLPHPLPLYPLMSYQDPDPLTQ